MQNSDVLRGCLSRGGGENFHDLQELRPLKIQSDLIALLCVLFRDGPSPNNDYRVIMVILLIAG